MTVVAAWGWTTDLEVWVVLDLLLVSVTAALIALPLVRGEARDTRGGVLLGLGTYAELSILDTAWFNTVFATGLGNFALLLAPLPLIAGGWMVVRRAPGAAGRLARFWPWAIPGVAAMLLAFGLPVAYVDSYKTLGEIASHFGASAAALILPFVTICALILVVPGLLGRSRPGASLGASAGLALGVVAVGIGGALSAMAVNAGAPPPGSLLQLLGGVLVLVGAWRATQFAAASTVDGVHPPNRP